MNGFGRVKSLGVFLGILLIVIGVVFFAYSEKVVEVIAVIIGAGILMAGVLNLVSVLMTRRFEDRKSAQIFNVIVAVVFVALGVYLLFNSHITISAIGVTIGIFAFFSAADRLAVALDRIRQKLRFAPTLISAIVHAGFGILLIYSSISMFSAIIMLAGAYLILAGIMIILSTSYFFDFK